MKDLVLFIVKQLANNPGAVSAEESESDGVLEFKLTVAEEDKGRIIGKQGKVIKAIRALASAAASKQGKRVAVDIP